MIRDSIGYSSRLFETYGPIVRVRQGRGPNLYSPLPDCPGTICAYGPDYTREVTTQHEVYYKYPLSMGLSPQGEVSPRTRPLKYYGVGLFGVNSDLHRQHRRLLMPAFHKKQIEAYRDTMVAITEATLNRWQAGERRCMTREMQAITMRVATKTLFGEAGEQDGEIGQAMRESMALLMQPLTRLLPYDLPGLPYRRFLNLVHKLNQMVGNIISRKRLAGADDNDLLSLLIRAHDQTSNVSLTEDELIGHVGVIFAAGHETSANALTWTLFLLSQHPPVLADLCDELEGVLRGGPPTVEQLGQLPLLENVIKESMRLLTPVPWNARVTSRPTELGGYHLPAGAEVFVSIYHTHHMPDLYPAPEVFNPRRWETIKPTIFEYNPFSAGPRMCIGAGFAMLEIKIALALLLQRYRLQYTPQVKVNRAGLIVLTPQHGMPMLIQKQDRNFNAGVGGVRGNIREMVSLPE
jgi:cytochrome P450